MRKLTASFALVAALGWALSAQAGMINSTWDISSSSGNTIDTQSDPDITIPATNITGQMCLKFTNDASTKSSIPHSDPIDLTCFTSTATGTYAFGIVKATLKGKLKSTVYSLHLGSTGMFAGSQTAKIMMNVKAHCQSFFACMGVPGSWPSSQNKYNTFTASVHLPPLSYMHTASSEKILSSGKAVIKSPNSHLVSSQGGYHTMHIRAVQQSTP